MPDGDQAGASPSAGQLDRCHALLARLFCGYALAAGLTAAAASQAAGWTAELRASGVAGLLTAAALTSAAGLAAAAMMNGARRPSCGAARRRLHGGGRIAQGVVVPLVAACAALSVRAWPAGAAPDAAAATALGAALALLAFPALLAERFVAAVPASVLPEAPALRRLLAVPVIVALAAGALEALRGQGFAAADLGLAAVGALLMLLAAELAVRGLLRWFQPPAAPERARAAVASLLAELPGWALRPGGVAEPLRAHLGLDFSRSWALAFLRRAALPAVALTGLFCWSLSGVVLLRLDQRGVYERFGAPAAVLGPGLHVVLPWPAGRVRPVELGVVHAVALGSEEAAAPPPPAEAPPPPEADRLWERPHPAEADWLTAGGGAAGQSFALMSADIRVLYRAGLSDADAIHVLYSVAEPDRLVREAAGRAVCAFFAARTVDSMLDGRQARMADELEAQLSQALAGTGLEVVSVTVEAVHPPVGAAAAYHGVQAAEIVARTAVSAEAGRAAGTASLARETAWDALDRARAASGETAAAAAADEARFGGDRASRDTGERAFLLDRYLAAVSAAFARAPLTIVDARVPPGMAPVIDLRPFAAAGRAGTDDPD